MIPMLTRQRQSQLLVGGLLLVMLLGMTTGLALVIGVLWLVSQVLILAIESVLLALHTLASLYETSGPFIQCCLLLALVYGSYRAGKYLLVRRAGHARF